MRHFATLKEARQYASEHPHNGFRVYRKKKGMPNRFKKPYMVGTYLDWLNYNW